jgi:hypothetical protein
MTDCDNLPEAHLWVVLGGELKTLDPNDGSYRDPQAVVFYGAFNDRAEACAVWKGASMQNVDNALYRVRIVPVY